MSRDGTKWIFLRACLLLLSFQEMFVDSEAVRFLRQPSNQTTVAGAAEVIVQCHIQDYQHTINWIKDGFAMFGLGGYSPVKRYSVQRSSTAGVQNLRIENVTIDDDGVYECQDPLEKVRSREAYLNVQVPPKRLVISVVDERGRITVRENEPVTVHCSALESKPASQIMWKLRENDVFRPTVDRKLPGSKLTTSVSALSITPSRSHNGTTVQCLAKHPASQSVIVATATLNVLYPPGQPSLSGPAEDRLIAGRNFSLSCESIGGNPRSTITWKVGDRAVPGELTTTNERALSVLRYKLRPEDDGKMVTCSAASPALTSPLATGTRIQVLYPPSDIVVSQYPQDGVFENSSLSLSCRTAQSNPRSTLSWFRDGVPLTSQSGDVAVTSVDLTSHSQSTLTITRVTRSDAVAKYVCRSSIPELNYQKDTTARVNINYPPQFVTARVFHLAEGKDQAKLHAGQTVQLKCSATGGNPVPELEWYRDGEKVSSDERSVIRIDPSQVLDCKADKVTCSVIEIVLERSDNARKFECRASHVASNVPKRDSVELEVFYAPESVQITQFPQTLVTGERMSFLCETAPSYPASTVTWWYGGKLIVDGSLAPGVNPTVTTSNRPSRDFVGFITRSQLFLSPTSSFDQTRVTCRATNEVLKETVEGEAILDVKFPPEISSDRLKYNTTVGSSEIVVGIPVKANPDNLTFRWWKYLPLSQSGAASKSRAGSIGQEPAWGRRVALVRDERVWWATELNELRIGDVRSEDGGLYQVEVKNERGFLAVNFTIDVFYPPQITRFAAPSYVTVGSDATLLCEFKGHPLLPTTVHWTKLIPNQQREVLEVKSTENTSTLFIRNVTSQDRGQYRCVATNGIGLAAQRTATFSVLFSAEIDRRHSPPKVARPPSSGGKMSAELVCSAAGNPRVSFAWMDADGSELVSGVSDSLETGYVIDDSSSANDVYTSRLFVNTRVVHTEDDRVVAFRCVATNSLGRDEFEIKLVPRGPPDAPSDVIVTNVTHDAMALTWLAGFDGGAPQTFLLQYFVANSITPHCKFDQEVGEWSQVNVPHSRTSYVIDGLRHATSYGVCMLAFNSFGRSGATKTLVVTTRRVEASAANAEPGNQLPTNYMLIIAASCALCLVLLILIVFIVVRCLRHRNASMAKSVRTESESLTTPNASLTSSENGDHLRHARQTSSFIHSNVDCGAPSGGHRFGGSGQSLERKSISRVTYSADEMSGARSELSHCEPRHVPYFQGRRSSRDTSVSSLLHDETSYTNEMYQRCGSMLPRSRFSDCGQQVALPGERERFLGRCSVDMLSCDGTNQHSTPPCSHQASWDSCVRCIEERSLAQASGRCCDIIRHAGEMSCPQGQRYHSLSLNPKRQTSLALHHQYPLTFDSSPVADLPDCLKQQQAASNGNCQTLPPMPRSYSSSSFLHSKRRYQLDDLRYQQLQPLLSPGNNPTPRYKDEDSLYAVSVHEAPARASPDVPNESGLYVLNVGVDHGRGCGGAGTEASVGGHPLTERPAVACVRNSWISSSSSTSDYGSQQSGSREKQNPESEDASGTRASSSEISASSSRQLIPAKMVTCPSLTTTSPQRVQVGVPTAVLPPVSFQDTPDRSASLAPEEQGESMVFLGVDSDGTLFV